MSKLRLSITMSLDGYAAGPDQTEENPLGIGGMELHEWFFPLRAFREMHGGEGGEVNASSAVVGERRGEHRRHDHGPQHVWAGPGSVAGSVLEGLVGRGSSLPPSGIRAHPPLAPAA